MTTATAGTDVVVDNAADEAALAANNAEAVEVEVSAAEGEDEYDKLFAEELERAAKRKAANSGDTPNDGSDDKATALAATPIDGKDPVEKPVVAAPKVDDDEAFVALLPVDKQDAARARFAAAAKAEADAAKTARDNRSMAGRVSAMQRQLDEAKGKPPAEVKRAATVEDSAEWKEFAESYPEIAKGIEAKFAATQPGGDATDVTALVEYVKTEQRNRMLTEAWDAVEAVHHGWRDTAATPAFQEWKASSTTYEKLASSDEITDAIALFDLYEAHQSKNKPATPVVDQKATADAARLTARRTAQAEGAKAPAQTGAQVNHGVDMNDPDQMFAFFAGKANGRMKRRNQ